MVRKWDESQYRHLYHNSVASNPFDFLDIIRIYGQSHFVDRICMLRNYALPNN